MKHPLVILAILAALVYGLAAYTRPHEPAGRALQAVLRTWCPGLARQAAPAAAAAAPQPRDPATEQRLELHSMRSAGYTLAECCEIYGATTDVECYQVARDYYTPAELAELYPTH